MGFMIAAVNPLHPAETLSTLQYAQQYSNLRSNQESMNKLGAQERKALGKMQYRQREFTAALTDTNWTRATLTAQKLLRQRESAGVKHLFKLLDELERAEQYYAEEKERVVEAKRHLMQKEKDLLIVD